MGGDGSSDVDVDGGDEFLMGLCSADGRLVIVVRTMVDNDGGNKEATMVAMM